MILDREFGPPQIVNSGVAVAKAIELALGEPDARRGSAGFKLVCGPVLDRIVNT